MAWNSSGSLGVYANRIMSPTGFNTNSIPFVFAGVIDGPVANKSVFTQPANMTLEYTTNGSTWSTYPLSNELKKSIFLGKGSANTFFAIGGPSATGKSGEKTRLTINGTDRYTTIFGVYIWASTNGAGNILCDIETSTFGAKTTFTKKVSGAMLNGWGGPNYIGFNCTYGGSNSDDHTYSIRFTFSCNSYVSGKVAQIGEISLMGSTNWTMPYNLGARGHMYDWDSSQNVVFPAGVTASWFSGSGSNLTSLNASNLASGTVPIARIPTGTSSSTVALGNHTHSQYASTSHNHSAANITSGTLSAARLPASGVTAGSYGPTANVTGTNNATINIPQITVDAYGRVTSVTNRVYTSKDTNTTYSLSSFGITATAAELNKLDGCTATTAELNYVDGVTSNIQTQLNGKASSSHTHNELSPIQLTNQSLNNYYGNVAFYYAGGGNTCTNKPSGVDNFGMFSFRSAGGWYTQILYGSDDDLWTRRYASSSWTSWVKIYSTANKPTPADIGAATSSHTHTQYALTSHTHNYAGSSSAGGAATSANKLNTNAGNSTQPVYFSNGVPVAATAYSNAITQGLKVDDSRNDNPAPNSASFTKQALTVDFKYNNKINNPTGFGGNYCGLISLAPWSETSGGNGYQIAIGYNSNAHPRLAVRSADLSATSWGTWYKIYTSDDKPTPAEIGAATSSHTHSNYLTTTGTAAAATKLATARTINGTNFDGIANITTSYWGTARTITIGNTGKSVNGSGNVSWSLSEIGAASSSHTHSYLPLSGGTLTGRLTANAKISATTSGGSWINGKTVTNASYCITTQPDSAGNSYYPFFAAKSGGGHTVNIGCLANDWGFYGYKSSRTDNGTDWQFTFDAGTGAITHNSTMTQSGAYISKNSLDASASSSSASYSASFAIQDKNGNQMGDIQCSKQTNNRNAIQIEASRTVSGTSYYNNLRLCISNTGGLSYTISSAAAFRNVLGLGNTSGAVPVANGGTGATAKREAKINLGITSGTGSAPSSGTYGDIYIQYS